MNKTDEIRYCNNCGELIPATRNKGAIYCTIKCGWMFRNRGKAEDRKKLEERDPGLYKSYKVVKNLDRMGINDISIESATDLCLDFNCHHGEMNFDHENGTTEIRLFEYSYTLYGNRLKIKKLTNERT